MLNIILQNVFTPSKCLEYIYIQNSRWLLNVPRNSRSSLTGWWCWISRSDNCWKSGRQKVHCRDLLSAETTHGIG